MHFVQARLADAERRRRQPHWLWRVLGIMSLGPLDRVADVRWFSEYDVVAKACSGHLLARWLVTATTITPFEYDFDCESPESHPQELVTYLHALIVDFALIAECSTCIVVVTDSKGRIESAEYMVPEGAHSSALGQLVGTVMMKRVRRPYGDQCVPAGWRPRRS